MRRTLVALLSVALTAGAAGVAGAARSGPLLTADPQAAEPGSTVTLRGTGFPRDARIALLAGPHHAEAVRIGTARTGRRGSFTAAIRIRSRAEAGRLVALACYDDCRVQARTAFRISPR